MELGLKNKVALVTGSGRGLGRSIAEKLAEENVNIAITDINLDLANTTAKEIADKYKGVESIPTWVANGFWFFDTWVKEWTSHADLPRPETEYYENSIALTHEQAYNLLIDKCPYEDDTLKKLSKG